MTTLPIQSLRQPLIEACRNHRRLIVQAPTGSGKSTQIPQFLLDEGLVSRGRIVVLQPRRIAARLLAARVAHERGVKLGDEVGYQIRFEDVSGPRTRIKYETEGILLRQLMSDPLLSDVDAICFDEFHERHLHADIMLARAKHLQETARPDLLLLVMSATLEAGPLETYFEDSTTLTSEGRTYPVHVEYLPRPVEPKAETVMDVAAGEMERCIREGIPGDALIFMPGAYEIQRTIQNLQQSSHCRDCIILPLHGELTPRDQDAAVAAYERRKIIVATNVAETSLTIDGVRIVIDSGLARIPRFDPHRSINTLLIEKISRASADQRTGRAGRTAPGHCIRCWTDQEHRARAMHELPEIKRLDLAEAVLTIKAAGIEDLATFPWFEPPVPKTLDQAIILLTDLGALNPKTAAITELGRRMAAFPLHPRYARMLLAAANYGCVRQMCLMAALTQGRPILIRRPGAQTQKSKDDILGDQAPSDFFIHMRAWHYALSVRFDLEKCRRIGVHAQSARQIQPVYDTFLRMAEQQGLPINERAPDDEAVCKCILAGFADQVAMRRDQGTLNCVLVHGRTGVLSRDSVVQDAPLIVASEIDEIQSGGELRVLLNLASRIDEVWLAELFPDAVQEMESAIYDPHIKRVIRENRVVYHDLVLRAKRGGDPSPDAAAALLTEEVIKGRLTLNHWDDQVEQWILRVNQLATWCPEFEFPVIADAERELIIQQLCLGCFSHKDVRVKPVWPAVRSILSAMQLRLLDQHAPERINIGGKRPFKLTYQEQAAPHLSVRMQELFGVTRLPDIAMGRIKPVIHILAPNQRPVQITQDLTSFWKDHYPPIRQEMKRRYPKHAWPENPLQP